MECGWICECVSLCPTYNAVTVADPKGTVQGSLGPTLLPPPRSYGGFIPKMAEVTICLWNVRRLNSKFKQALIFEQVKRLNPHILCFQETHLMGSKVLALKKQWVAQNYQSTYSNYARGVAILIRKGLPFSCHQVISDPKGQYLLLYAMVQRTPIVLVTIYIPPPVTVTVFTELSAKLSSLPICPTIIMGDFNSVL